MCGIVGIHLTESVPSKEFFKILIEGASIRGTDGLGYTFIKPK